MLALRVIQGSTARRSEIRAPEKHVGADPRSGVYPTEPGDPGQYSVALATPAWQESSRMRMARGHRLLASAVAAPPLPPVPVLFGIRLVSLRTDSPH